MSTEPEMSEEQEIEIRNHLRAFKHLEAVHEARNKQRPAPSIGYGVLFEDGDDRYNYTLTLDIAITYEEGHSSTLLQLEEMVERVVKQWLMDVAPSRTRTSLVDIVD